jgi:hypothetical protein
MLDENAAFVVCPPFHACDLHAFSEYIRRICSGSVNLRSLGGATKDFTLARIRASAWILGMLAHCGVRNTPCCIQGHG